MLRKLKYYSIFGFTIFTVISDLDTLMLLRNSDRNEVKIHKSDHFSALAERQKNVRQKMFYVSLCLGLFWLFLTLLLVFLLSCSMQMLFQPCFSSFHPAVPYRPCFNPASSLSTQLFHTDLVFNPVSRLPTQLFHTDIVFNPASSLSTQLFHTDLV